MHSESLAIALPTNGFRPAHPLLGCIRLRRRDPAVNSYFFEIVERAFDRFSWILVVYRKGRRRVIARASRDYRTPRKAARAARRLKRIVGDAPIVFAVAPAPDFTFEVLRDVLPLPVGSPES